MKNVVGQRIRDARRSADRKISQEELAARLQAMGLDIDQTALSRIENGERQITDIEVIAVCRALRVEVADLFSGTEVPGQ